MSHLKPLDIEPQPAWVSWALMPARLVVAAFLHMEQAMRPDVDTEQFGRAFRLRDNGDDRMIREAVAKFDRKHGARP